MPSNRKLLRFRLIRRHPLPGAEHDAPPTPVPGYDGHRSVASVKQAWELSPLGGHWRNEPENWDGITPVYYWQAYYETAAH